MLIKGRVRVVGRRIETEVTTAPAELRRLLDDESDDVELMLAGPDDELVYHVRDGVEICSRLGELGIASSALYHSLREAIEWQASATVGNRERWEYVYDSIGLSLGEIGMRQRVKRAVVAAQTLRDVAELLAGTYFDARFQSEDGSRVWHYFDREDFTVEEQREDRKRADERIALSPDAVVRHLASWEDVHEFVLLEPPE